jgi:hypothetical protein
VRGWPTSGRTDCRAGVLTCSCAFYRAFCPRPFELNHFAGPALSPQARRERHLPNAETAAS